MLTRVREFRAEGTAHRGLTLRCVSFPKPAKPSDSDGWCLVEPVSYKEFPSDSDGSARPLACTGALRGKLKKPLRQMPAGSGIGLRAPSDSLKIPGRWGAHGYSHLA